MIVQKVVMPTTGALSFTVLGDDFAPVEAAERYLAHLSGIERSPNTVRAYAHGLKLWLEFLALRQVDWDAAGVEDVSGFVSWLRSPGANVIVLDADAGQRSTATVNRHLAAVFGFYDFHARSGVGLAASLVAWRRVSRGSYKPFLHHVTKGRPIPTRPIKLKVAKRIPSTLNDDQLRAILEACEHLRDRFLLALLMETGMRVGQALGLRHADFSSRSREVTIVPRADNANGARAKCSRVSVIPVSTGLVRLYSDYLHTEYGPLDSDYVFVNLFAEPRGRALRYHAVAGLVSRIRKRTGVTFTLHTLRHTPATELIRDGVATEVVSKLLTHSSVATTSQAYVHLEAEDLRSQLVDAGVWGTDQGVVSALSPQTSPEHSSLLSKLFAAVRPEFRGDLIRPNAHDPVLGRGSCLVEECSRLAWCKGLCAAHHNRWRREGKPEVSRFARTTAPIKARANSYRVDAFDLSTLPAQAKLEIAYALQCRSDAHGAGIYRAAVGHVVELICSSGAPSLLDHPVEHWLSEARKRCPPEHSRTAALLRYSYRCLEDLDAGGDVEIEYAKDCWEASRLGIAVRREP